MNHLIVASIAYAFFIVCPRMAGITSVIARATHVNLVLVSVIGTLIALPLIVLMVVVFKQWGLWAALALAVGTDLVAALVMGGIGWKAGFETFVIALFVLIGVKAASFLSSMF
jgi:uncharacterized membrane protein